MLSVGFLHLNSIYLKSIIAIIKIATFFEHKKFIYESYLKTESYKLFSPLKSIKELIFACIVRRIMNIENVGNNIADNNSLKSSYSMLACDKFDIIIKENQSKIIKIG